MNKTVKLLATKKKEMEDTNDQDEQWEGYQTTYIQILIMKNSMHIHLAT